MKKQLSEYQQTIIDKMKNGYQINTNEGANYKAWLVNGKDKIYIRKDTVQILFANGYIVEGISTSIRFVYILK